MACETICLVTFLWCVVGLLTAVGPIGLGLGKLGYMYSHFLGAYVKKQPSTPSFHTNKMKVEIAGFKATYEKKNNSRGEQKQVNYITELWLNTTITVRPILYRAHTLKKLGATDCAQERG